MVNDDILIKFARKRGFSKTWPDQVNKMKSRMTEMKLGFPGIGNDHLSLMEYQNLNPGEIFIYDPYVESGAIGDGLDSQRDPERIKFRWRDTIQLPPLPPEFLVFRVDPRPTLNGGPGYYYFYKSYRDFRY